MNKLIYTACLLFLFYCSGCICALDGFDRYTTTVQLNQDFTLSLSSGNITPLDTIAENITYCIEFDQVKGGRSILFGIWTIREGNGYTAKRLLINNKQQKTQYKISIDDLRAAEQPIMDLNKLMVP